MLAVEGSDRGVPLLACPWVVWGGIGVVGSAAVGAPWEGGLVALAWAGLGVVWAPSHGRRLLCAAALLVFWFAMARAGDALAGYEAARSVAIARLGVPQRCTADVTVRTSPTVQTRAPLAGANPSAPAAPGPSAGSGDERSVSWLGQSFLLHCERGDLSGVWWLALHGGPEDLARGDEVRVVAGLAPVQLFRNAGLPDPTPSAARRRALLSGAALDVEVLERSSGWTAKIDRLRARVRARIEATYPRLVAPLGRALVLGESDLPEDDALAFSQSGLMHLLAVSGTHLVIAVLALVQGLRALLVRVGFLARRYDVARVSAAWGVAMALLYADFAGGSGSAWRAAYMLAAMLGSRCCGRKLGGAGALGSSLCVGAAIDPLVGADLSFLLSGLATAGLIGLGQPLSRLTERGIFAHGPLGKLRESLVATLASSLCCAPLLALLDGQMTWIALGANVIAGPFGELAALPACLLHACAAWCPPVERGLALVGGGALYAVRAVALWSASVEVARFDVPLPAAVDVVLLTWSVLGVCWCVGRRTRRLARAEGATLALALVACPVVQLTRSPDPTPELVVTAHDVGQGDALSIEFPGGALALVDGGGFPGGVPDPGERVLTPWLRRLGRDSVDLVVLSHAHPDHLLGLLSLARTTRIAELWHPAGAAAERGPYGELVRLVRERGGVVRGPRELCDAPRNWGPVRVDVVAPCPGPSGGGLNDESLVLRVAWGNEAALLTGDIEALGEQRVLESGRPLGADWLKVPHHGSHTSSCEALLARVAPRWAAISSGVRNRFDHPRQITLDRLRERHIAALRTDRLGSISWHTDGSTSWVSAFGSIDAPADGALH
ncbi:MAG TPA: DNA internalization-related competence protein ComEC/Rec2 [Polyangiaceae bacterium]|nr:DNA internalization-related competence protein ComEC/Rec2 [Polyangiaceae bacterium]